MNFHLFVGLITISFKYSRLHKGPDNPKRIEQRPLITTILAISEHQSCRGVHIHTFAAQSFQQKVLESMLLMHFVVENRGKQDSQVLRLFGNEVAKASCLGFLRALRMGSGRRPVEKRQSSLSISFGSTK